jgi:dienelactone hydrolase
MPKRMLVLGVVFLALAIFPAARCAAEANHDDAVVDHFFSAVRNGKFSAATRPFGARMKALSPAGLKGSWDQVYAQQGPLLGWKIFDRQNFPNGRDEVSVQLRFHHATADSIIVVASKSGEITSVLFKLPATSPPYAEQTKFHSDDVTIGTYKLSGTLTIPNGKGPFPAVALIQGAGPNDRDETVGANHPFADIADGLASRGIVALRYDKRTYAHRNLDSQKTTVDTEVIEDGVAAVRVLRARRDVAQDRIFVIGHSLGAMLAPEIAKKARPVAGIVMLAPSGRKLPQLIVEQTRFMGQASPGQLAEIEQQADQLSAHKMPPTQNFFGAPASYYYDLEARDEVAIARSLDVPILILHGSRDYPAVDEDLRDWQTGLKGDAKVQVETFPGLNHLLIAGTDKPTPAEYSAPGHVDSAVIGTIASFIANGSATTAAGAAPAHQAASN